MEGVKLWFFVGIIFFCFVVFPVTLTWMLAEKEDNKRDE